MQSSSRQTLLIRNECGLNACIVELGTRAHSPTSLPPTEVTVLQLGILFDEIYAKPLPNILESEPAEP